MEKKSFISAKLVLAVALLLFCILGIIGLFKFGSILAIIMVYPWILSKVSGVVFNQYLAQLIALPIAIALVWGVFKLVFSFNRKKRTAGLIFLAALFMLHSAFMFLVTKEQYFQPLTGVAQKYYTANPLTGEIQVFDQPIFDAFGQKARVVDSQKAQDIVAQKMYPNTEIPAEKIANFFDRTTGKPLIWYDIYPDSTFHFFLRNGYSGITGKELKPVTPETVKSFFSTLKGEETKKRLSGFLSEPPASKSPEHLSVFNKIAAFKGSLDLDPEEKVYRKMFFFLSPASLFPFIFLTMSICFLVAMMSTSIQEPGSTAEGIVKSLRNYPVANFSILFSVYFFFFLGFSIYVYGFFKSWFWIAAIIFLIGFFYVLLLAIIFYENVYGYRKRN